MRSRRSTRRLMAHGTLRKGDCAYATPNLSLYYLHTAATTRPTSTTPTPRRRRPDAGELEGRQRMLRMFRFVRHPSPAPNAPALAPCPLRCRARDLPHRRRVHGRQGRFPQSDGFPRQRCQRLQLHRPPQPVDRLRRHLPRRILRTPKVPFRALIPKGSAARSPSPGRNLSADRIGRRDPRPVHLHGDGPGDGRRGRPGGAARRGVTRGPRPPTSWP